MIARSCSSTTKAAARFDAAAGTLEIAGAETKQIWRLMETDLPPSELATLFSGAG